MQHPHVNVSVEQYATQTVSVMGQVNEPGAYPIATPQSIVRVLSLAGGLANGADRNITIERHSDPTQTVKYFYSNHPDVAFNTSTLIYPGDTVIVPSAPIVYVLGDVNRPGGFVMNNATSQVTVLEAVAMAGSTAKTSSANNARLIRKTSSGGQEDVQLRLADIQKGAKPDFALRPDDIIYVPYSNLKNAMMSSANIVTSTGTALLYTFH
jgi:polysaccharide export outer membrane protein